MKSIFLISSLLLTLNATTSFSTTQENNYLISKCTNLTPEDCLLQNVFDYSKFPIAEVDDIKVYEVEEEVNINFDTKAYLPENFNPLKGKHDIDWSKIELIEIEEEVIICFNTKAYLPENFNPLKGKHDIDWSKIELIEIEEEVILDFDAKAYLPKNFNPLKGMTENKLIL